MTSDISLYISPNILSVIKDTCEEDIICVCVITGSRITGRSRYYIGGSAGNRPRTSKHLRTPTKQHGSKLVSTQTIQPSFKLKRVWTRRASTRPIATSIATAAEAGPEQQGYHTHFRVQGIAEFPTGKGNPGNT